MVRIKILKDYKDYKKDDIINVTPNVAFGLIDKGIAMVSKDMVSNDYIVAKINTKSKKNK